MTDELAFYKAVEDARAAALTEVSKWVKDASSSVAKAYDQNPGVKIGTTCNTGGNTAAKEACEGPIKRQATVLARAQGTETDVNFDLLVGSKATVGSPGAEFGWSWKNDKDSMDLYYTANKTANKANYQW